MRERTNVFNKKTRGFHPINTKSIICIVILSIVSLLLSTKEITDESVVSLHGDPPRHMMNGVYFYDLIKNLPLTDPIEYSLQYFARYPALSLGHHPILLGIAEAPFYAVFGVSVFSARLTIAFFMLLAVIMWFLLIRAIYDQSVAFFSSLLFVTTPFVVDFSQVVMTEVPTLSLVILSTYFFYKYCELDKGKYIISFIIAFILSCLSKQTAVFILPVFPIYFLVTKGTRVLITKKGILFVTIATLVILTLITMSFKYSPFSVLWLKKEIFSNIGMSRILHPLKFVWNYHLSVPVLIFSVISICVSIYRKDKRAVFFILWIISLFMLVTLTGAPEPRYAIYWVPAFCLFAATTINFFQHRLWQTILPIMLLIIICYQFVVSLQLEQDCADGYEQAANYVVANRMGQSVLYSSKVDTGYFVFFTRKHNPCKDMVVLRADKMLVTSLMDQLVDDRITERKEIYEILQDFGVGYVVVEDQEYESLPLKWLREEVRTDNFILRKSIPIRSNRNKLRDVSLDIYEYKKCTVPKSGKILHMNIPLVGKSVTVNYDDLLRKRGPIKDGSGK